MAKLEHFVFVEKFWLLYSLCSRFHFSHIHMIPLACCCLSLSLIIFLIHRKVDMTGEVHNLITEKEFIPGVYRVEFDTKAYWKEEGRTPFHQMADVCRAVMTLLYS